MRRRLYAKEVIASDMLYIQRKIRLKRIYKGTFSPQSASFWQSQGQLIYSLYSSLKGIVSLCCNSVYGFMPQIYIFFYVRQRNGRNSSRKAIVQCLKSYTCLPLKHNFSIVIVQVLKLMQSLHCTFLESRNSHSRLQKRVFQSLE